MKFTGAILLWTAFTLTGIKISSLLKKRVLILEETIVLLRSLEAEINFARSDIRKILNNFSNESSMRNLRFLNIFSDCNENTDFHLLWYDAVSSFPFYKRDEKFKLLQLGSFLGTTDAVSQIKAINLYESFFDNYLKNAMADNDKYGKAASLFGMFFGASVFIIII